MKYQSTVLKNCVANYEIGLDTVSLRLVSRVGPSRIVEWASVDILIPSFRAIFGKILQQI